MVESRFNVLCMLEKIFVDQSISLNYVEYVCK